MTSWREPELDQRAAEAVALVALYITASPDDSRLAAELLDEFTTRPDGVALTVGGLISLCATLLALHEFDTGLAPPTVLHHAALAIQGARSA
jgi:hypothetical protein